MYFLFGIHTLCKSHSYKQFGTVLVPHTQLLRLRGKMLTYFNISIVLKTQDKFGNCQRPVFSLRCISTYMHEKKKCENFDSIGCRSCLSHKLCASRWLEFETSADVSNSIQMFKCEITSFSKTTSDWRGLFLTMFYTTNSSPMLAKFLC